MGSLALTIFGRGVGSAGRVMTLGRKNEKGKHFAIYLNPASHLEEEEIKINVGRAKLAKDS